MHTTKQHAGFSFPSAESPGSEPVRSGIEWRSKRSVFMEEPPELGGKSGQNSVYQRKKAIARRQKKPTDFKTQPNCKKCYNFLMKKGGFPLTGLL